MLYIEQQAIYFYSPWVDKYEEAKENQYSADMQAILGLKSDYKFLVTKSGRLATLVNPSMGNAGI
jgi:hypothetical protein